MAVSLVKGQKVDLTKGNPGLSKILVGLGWDVNQNASGYNFDLDASVLLLGAGDRLKSVKDVVYYGNLTHSSGAVQHMGDKDKG